MTHLCLNQNDLSGYKVEQISIFLWNNKKLSHLSMRECKLNSDGAMAIAEGMQKNIGLKYLDLAYNKFKPDSLEKWATVLGRTSLTHLDLSGNDIDDKGVLYILQGLQVMREVESKT